MKYLFVILGIAVGMIQFFLLKKTVEYISAQNKKFLLFIILKLIIYALAVFLLLTFFGSFIIHAGIGLGIGMIAFAFINFIVSVSKYKSNDKGDDIA